MNIKDYLQRTDPRHSDMVDAYAYMLAAEMAALKDEYLLLYIKRKPWYLPEFAYKWILKMVLTLASFHKY